MTAAMYMIILLTGIFFLGLIALIAAWLIQWRYQVKLDYFSKVMNATGKALMAVQSEGPKGRVGVEDSAKRSADTVPGERRRAFDGRNGKETVDSLKGEEKI